MVEASRFARIAEAKKRLGGGIREVARNRSPEHKPEDEAGDIVIKRVVGIWVEGDGNRSLATPALRSVGASHKFSLAPPESIPVPAPKPEEAA